MLKRFLLNDRAILWLIALNALILFAESFATPYKYALAQIDNAITTIFVLEAIIKIREWSWKGYWRDSWNRFDFTLVVLSAPAVAWEIGVALLSPEHAGTGLEAVMVLRVARSLKFFRSIRFLPGIDGLIEGSVLALQKSVSLFVGFVIGLFIVALLNTRLFGTPPIPLSEQYNHSAEEFAAILENSAGYEYFGDPLRSLYSTFKLFTVEGWFDIPDAVADELGGSRGWMARMYFAGVTLICGILGLSLVNSVFVEAMTADENDAIMQKLAENEELIRRLFTEIQDLKNPERPPSSQLELIGKEHEAPPGTGES